ADGGGTSAPLLPGFSDSVISSGCQKSANPRRPAKSLAAQPTDRCPAGHPRDACSAPRRRVRSVVDDPVANYFFFREPGTAFGAGLALVCGSALFGPRGSFFWAPAMIRY